MTDNPVKIKSSLGRLLRRGLRAPALAGILARNLPYAALDAAYLQRSWRKLRKVGERPSLEQNLLALLIQHGDDSQSQLGQDLFALAAKSDLDAPGFFVEFGATDGKALSNSHLLEKKFSWQGLLAEPNPIWHAELAANRNATIRHDCIGPRSGEEVEFIATDQPELATIASFSDHDDYGGLRTTSQGRIKLVTVSLLDFLEQNNAPQRIDYLSIDTEGSEFDILKAFDFARYDIRALTVEHNFTQNRNLLFELLSKNGFRRVLTSISRWDDWYIKPR